MKVMYESQYSKKNVYDLIKYVTAVIVKLVISLVYAVRDIHFES